MYEYEATIIDVYDGDTVTALIDLGFSIYIKKRIRLNGIDTPEIRTLNIKEKEYGLEVRDYLRELILNKKVTLDTYKPDKYGRCLADIYLGKMNINNHLINKRYAVPYYGGKKHIWFK
jgi:micrococcal nuclease